jgi:hypothetical protein
MVFIASPSYDNRADNNLKEAEAGKIRYSLLFFLAKCEKCCYMEKIPGLSARLGGGNGKDFRTGTTANPDQ